MYISKIHLRAFGKFIYKRIHLKKKLNIIYGENETGKSTIHSFLESILYGFDEDADGYQLYNKYKPWNSNLYKGSMTISNTEDKKYKITRDFLLGTTQVYNKELDENKNPVINEENIELPGEHFFHINKTSFRNTVSIRQLGNKTEKELSTELKNKIINLTKSRDESISIDRILNTLNGIKDEAGSENNPKTLLGQYSLRLNELKETKEKSINANRQVMFLAMERKKISSKIHEINMRIEKLHKELSDYELSLERDKFLKAKPIKEELDEIIANLSKYNEENMNKSFSISDYEESLKLYSSLNKMRNDRHELCIKKEETETQLKTLQQDVSNQISDDFDIAKMNSNFISYMNNKIKIHDMETKLEAGYKSIKNINIDEIDKFIEDYNRVNENNIKIDIKNEILNSNNYDILTQFKKSQNIKSFMFSLLGTILLASAGLAGYAAYYYKVLEYYGGISIAVPGIISYLSASKSRKRALNAGKEIESIECQRAEYIKNIEELNIENKNIINNLGCRDFEDLKNNHDKKKNEKNIAEKKLKLLDYDRDNLNNLAETNKEMEKDLIRKLNTFNLQEISEENITKAIDIFNRKDSIKENIERNVNLINELNQDIVKMDKEVSFEEKRLNLILNSNNMSSIDEYKDSVEYYKFYEDLKNRKEYCENILGSIIGKHDFSELKEKTKNIMYREIKEIDKKEHQLLIFKLNEEKNKLLININDIEREIDEIESNVRGLAEVEEEIEFYEDKKNIFKEKIKIAEIAAEKIIQISDSIKGDFMPLLRRSISDNFSYLTGNKYKEVLIDEDMNISVISENNKERKIDIDSLSGGTLDQLYLSLRIGLSNILSGNQNIPIILDDSFVQYDSNRLNKSIEMLARESERRQIILFTCQEREVESAKQMNIKFNLIKL